MDQVRSNGFNQAQDWGTPAQLNWPTSTQENAVPADPIDVNYVYSGGMEVVQVTSEEGMVHAIKFHRPTAPLTIWRRA